ncbi:hypothetical protein [Sphingomonas sp. 1P08PE]|uniref:structural cement protein Gp24 n=1 Tax=Sphingomonas sp. 1P08PE TaxID=554122 RepID=UPI0039A0B30E
MAVLQNSFADDIATGYPGMEADGELSSIISRTLEAGPACAFGRPVYQGANDRGVTLTVSADLMGFALTNRFLVVTADRPVDAYAPGDTVRVKNRGKLWVQSTTATTDRAQVYITAAGAVTATASGNTAAAGWQFDDTIAAAGVVRIVRR